MGLGSGVDTRAEEKHPLLKCVSREAFCWFLSGLVFCSQMSPRSRFLFIEFLNGLFPTGDFGIDSLNSSLRVWRSPFLSPPVTQHLGAGLPGRPVAGNSQTPLSHSGREQPRRHGRSLSPVLLSMRLAVRSDAAERSLLFTVSSETPRIVDCLLPTLGACKPRLPGAPHAELCPQ